MYVTKLSINSIIVYLDVSNKHLKITKHLDKKMDNLINNIFVILSGIVSKILYTY